MHSQPQGRTREAPNAFLEYWQYQFKGIKVSRLLPQNAKHKQAKVCDLRVKNFKDKNDGMAS